MEKKASKNGARREKKRQAQLNPFLLKKSTVDLFNICFPFDCPFFCRFANVIFFELAVFSF